MKRLAFLTLILFLILTSCEKNQAPEISAIKNLTEIVVGASEVVLVLEATDDSENLAYSWTATGGEFASGTNSDSVVWIAPTSISNVSYTVTVIVSDEEYTVHNDIVIEVEGGKFIDLRDDNVYEFVQIGEQIWMAENLAYLPEVSPITKAPHETDIDYYVYAYDGKNPTEAKATSDYINYGVLYNWYAAEKSCPVNWHIPTDEDWISLIDQLKPQEGGKLKATGTVDNDNGYWYSPNEGATNESGFNALPGGYKESMGEDFGQQGIGAFFWTSTEGNNGRIWCYTLRYDSNSVQRVSLPPIFGYSVRCIKD